MIWIIIGIKNNLKDDKITKREHRGIQERRVILENKIWRIYTVYVRESVKNIKQELQVRISDNEGKNAMVIERHFNARTRNKSAIRWVEGEEVEGKVTK